MPDDGFGKCGPGGSAMAGARPQAPGARVRAVLPGLWAGEGDIGLRRPQASRLTKYSEQGASRARTAAPSRTISRPRVRGLEHTIRS